MSATRWLTPKLLHKGPGSRSKRKARERVLRDVRTVCVHMPTYEACCESGSLLGDDATNGKLRLSCQSLTSCTSDASCCAAVTCNRVDPITRHAHSRRSKQPDVLPRGDHLEHVIRICEPAASALLAVEIQQEIRSATSHVRHVSPSMWQALDK